MGVKVKKALVERPKLCVPAGDDGGDDERMTDTNKPFFQKEGFTKIPFKLTFSLKRKP